MTCSRSTASAVAQIGEIALREGVALEELTPRQASLEDAFMALTGDSVDFHAVARRGGGGVSAAVQPRPVTLATVIVSEWTKLRTLRSTLWSLLAAVFAMAVLGSAVAAVQMSRWSQLEPQERARYDAIDVGVGGYHLAQLAIGVLGVLVISGEYSTGMIRSSLMAVPHRLPGAVGEDHRVRGRDLRADAGGVAGLVLLPCRRSSPSTTSR